MLWRHPTDSTPRGRRDYAILRLLASLGLRAGEIVSLALDDICWRTAEIVVHGKGRTVERLPLLREIGEALAAYLRKDRGGSNHDESSYECGAPRIGLTGPAAGATLFAWRSRELGSAAPGAMPPTCSATA